MNDRHCEQCVNKCLVREKEEAIATQPNKLTLHSSYLHVTHSTNYRVLCKCLEVHTCKVQIV